MALTTREIVRRRLWNLGIAPARCRTAPDAVIRLVASQAQDYAGAKWALGLRSPGCTDDTVEQAVGDGRILRTHVLRPTWHFVAPADIRWLLALTGPRVHALNARRYRELELDRSTLRRCDAALSRELRDGHTKTRDELRAAFERAGVPAADGGRVAYILMQAELNGAICSGARRGRQFTYAWLDDRVPPAPPRTRDEALVELARRIFESRGPASVHDFAKWSGLTIADGRLGLEAIRGGFVGETIDGRDYWFTSASNSTRPAASRAHLLSVFDEYVSSYRDRRAIGGPEAAASLKALGAAPGYLIVLDGLIVGTWSRCLGKPRVAIQASPAVPLTPADRRAVEEAAATYGRFLGLEAALTWGPRR